MGSDPFRELIEGIKGLDDIRGESPDQIMTQSRRDEARSSESIPGVSIEFYRTLGQVFSIVYELENARKVMGVKPKGSYVGGLTLPSITSLDDFVGDYEGQLDYRGVRYEPKRIQLGEDLREGIVYQQTYQDQSDKMIQEMNGILEFLKARYKSE